MATILLVEDSPAVRKVLWHMLANLGHEVLEAGSAPQALELAASYEQPIELLITDVVMPHTNCDRFVDEMRQARRDIKVIFISGYSQDMLSGYGVEQTRSNFIQKPFSADDLAAKLREVLGESQARRAKSCDWTC